jgi:methanogenic corrinoid protein MtbC1
MSEEDDIILSELDDEELVQQMFDDLYDGLKEEIEEGVNILLERGWAPYQILTEALVGGMTIVGQDFRDGILFVPRGSVGGKRDEGWHGDPETIAGRNRRTTCW